MSPGARLAVGASLFFGLSYLPMLALLDLPRGVEIGWKGAGVGLLAIAALQQAGDRTGWALAIIMALGAIGDVLLDAQGLRAGATAFLAGHIIATGLYLSQRRSALSPSQAALAAVVVPLSVWIAWTLPADRGEAAGIAFYALFVAAMAGAAWISRFPRYRTGIGAMMFLASDLILFARLGPLANAEWSRPAVWLFYYIGQFLIFWGITHCELSGRSKSI